MNINPADRPKAIGLVLAIVAVFAFIAWRFIGGAKQAVPSPNTAVTTPTTSQIAEGQIVVPDTKTAGENLNNTFAGMGSGGGPVENPFRMPVPKTTRVDSTPQTNVQGGSGVPTAGNPDRTIDWGGVGGPGTRPLDPTQSGEAIVSNTDGVRVKGIIAPEGGYDSMAFIQIGDRGKGFRVGEEISPGMRIVGITSTHVSVRIGGTIVKAGVGQEIKPE
jgi:hypothetical protein